MSRWENIIIYSNNLLLLWQCNLGAYNRLCVQLDLWRLAPFTDILENYYRKKEESVKTFSWLLEVITAQIKGQKNEFFSDISD
jgi:hypothetical protein